MNLTANPVRSNRVIVHTPEPAAGAGQYVTELVRALAAEGELVELFCPENFSYIHEVAAAGVTILLAPMREVGDAPLPRRLFRNLVFALGALVTFWKSVKRRDIVHFQFALHLGLGLLFFFVARLKGAHVVLTVHDPLPHRWILPSPLRWLETSFLSISYFLCHKLIVHNQPGKQILVKLFHVSEDDVTVIPHGPLNLTPPPTRCDSISKSGQPLRLLMFGSLRENKGIHLAIQAVQQLQLNAHGRPVTLTIAGATPNSMEKPYWEMCQRLIHASPHGIEVIDRVIEDGEIASLFGRHDAVLLPYLQFFSDSGVAMLALSQRLPILATSAGGLGELLQASDCGILIDSPDLDGVATAIETIRSASPAWLKQKGLNGYLYALESRSWRLIAQQTRSLYHSLFRCGPMVVWHTPEPASSASLYVEALSTALAAEGVPVRVVCPANLQALPSLRQNPLIVVKPCCKRGTNLNASILTKIWENLRFVSSSAFTLLRSTKPGDIVHLQYILHLPFGLVFLVCAWLRNARIVFTVHDPLPHKFLFPAALRGIEMTTLRWAYQWSDVLVVHSDAGKRTVCEVFGIPAAKIRVIVHGPYELRKPVEECRESARLEVLFFGSLRENKAPHLAIQAVQRLSAEGVAIRLTIAGKVVNRKEEDYWARCRQLIDPNSKAIRLLEQFVADEDLPDLFSNCHCFVLPYTTFSSDSGVAYMAMANRKPIISTGAGGLAWLLEHSHGGLAISEATVEGVTAALRRAVEMGPLQMERMGQAGAQWVLANCSWRAVAQKTRAAYSQWIGGLACYAVARNTAPTVTSPTTEATP